ncbi:MAG TPA: glycosyltransferase family 4 protein [bacterium]|mgnify:CR=1 FL=1|nr:glycosyltransferase family 4 protein [bacterium]HPS29085.1 glycosyltransferase family 4 protein [bacterium]
MKILFISDNFPPEVNAPATRTIEHCAEWVKNGAEVTVITCAPNFPSGKVFIGYKNRLWQKEQIYGITVIRVWSYISSNEGFIKRILDYMSFSFSAFLAGLFIKCDIIVATSPQFFTALTGWELSIFKRKPWIFELRDLWPESIKAVGAMKNGFVLKILEKVELFLYRKASGIVSVTNSFKKNLIERGISEDKIHVITNGSNVELFKPVEKNELLLNDLGLKNKFIIGYIGTHGMAHGLGFILECMKKIENKDIHFIMIGEGADKKNLKTLAGKLELKNVTFLDSVPKEKISKYISITDVSLVPLRKCETFKTVIPSKIFESAAMNKPVLLGVEGESKEIIEKYNAGICFIPENEEAFLSAVKNLSENKELYSSFEKGCKKMARDYDRKTLAIKMLSIMTEIAKVKK